LPGKGPNDMVLYLLYTGQHENKNSSFLEWLGQSTAFAVFAKNSIAVRYQR
jgi:hypothetical protein